MLLISRPVLLDFDYYFLFHWVYWKLLEKNLFKCLAKNMHVLFFFFDFSSYIGVQSINNITLVSGVQQSDSVILWFFNSLIKIFGNLFLFHYISTYLISLVLPLCPQSLNVGLYRKSVPTLRLEGINVSKWESKLKTRN